ncbi:MAG: PD-(D/E)XK nuclease family protein [Longimicrobiales bacterium]|nr:PD-(D/E)XK nuclease family protein [Longimicrobiales bacterium]
MPPKPFPSPRLVDALAHAARERALDRKLLVAPTFGGGRELVRCLARRGRGWVGFEVTTPRPLALLLARPAMAADGLHPLDAFDQQAFLDEAMDGAMASGADGGLGDLSEGVGFREAVHGSVTALRLAGISPGGVRAARFRDVRKRIFLSRVLERYETLLRERRRADTATVLSLAVAALSDGGEGLPRVLGAEMVLLVPGLGTRGLAGRFLEALQRRGAVTLETDPVVGRPAPEGVLWRAASAEGTFSFLHAPELAPVGGAPVEIFQAASIYDELREVLRRVVARGIPWDEVEIVAADAAAYGSALHALSVRLGIPVTYAVGLPVERTRPGRAVQAYLDWIQGGFQAHVIRRLLEAGDLRPPRSAVFHAPGDLARRLRSLRVGWGRRRYRTQLRHALAALEGAPPRGHESEDQAQRRVRRERGELEALRSILFPALKATPSVPDRVGEGGEPVSPAELARGVRAFLRRVPKGEGPDAAARDQIVRVLDRVEATLRRRTHFEAAAAILRRHLEIRVRAPDLGRAGSDAGAPWSSEGGHLHLSDLEHGGFSGRRAVFVVGLDADRVPGAGGQDPVLTDAERKALGGDLPMSGDVVQERAFRLAALFARLRGSVTLSFGAWSAAEARSVSPSPVLLQALRLSKRDGTLTFEDLHRALGEVASPVARRGPALDSDDVWMQALGQGGVLRSGIRAVREAFPHLERGLSARWERLHGNPGPHHGLVTPRPELLDPRRSGSSVVLSASRLQDLGACPLRYFYASVLRIHPPDDPELDPDHWLDALQRGSLLHSVYEGTLREAKARGVLENGGALEPLAMDVLAASVRRWRDEIPSPGEGVRRREVTGLEEDVRSFVRMVREHGASWSKLEMRFGLEGAEPLVLDLAGGSVRIRGAVDRVDEDLEGLHVIDYKTGAVRDHEGETRTFNGGRRLQHAIYAEAAERALGRPVVKAAYHYPTRRGENEIISYPRLALAALPSLLDRLLEGVAAGAFVPTDSADDCRFCDFAPICRAREEGWGNVASPLAHWAGEIIGCGNPAFAHLAAARKFED